MKQFNLEEYRNNPSRKVVTRDGRNVRIICTDRRGDYPIIALTEKQGNDEETLNAFTENGRWALVGKESIHDLFFAPEKHEGWIIINKWADGERDTNGIIYHTKLDIPDIPIVGGKRVATIKIEWEE